MFKGITVKISFFEIDQSSQSITRAGAFGSLWSDGSIVIGRCTLFSYVHRRFFPKVFVYFLENKTGVRAIFESLQSRSSRIVADNTGKTIKILRTDNGGEYVNKDLQNYLKRCGIRFQTTCPHTPQQNGMAERMNRTIVEKSRCMLFGSNLDKSFWAEAVATAVYVTNRSPSRGLEGKTPEEIWSGQLPNLSHLRTFGCKACAMSMCHVPKKNRQKLDAKSEEYIFVGYCDETKGYRLLHPITKRLVKGRDVVFLENQVIGEIINSDIFVSDESNEFVVQFDENIEKYVTDQSNSGWNFSLDCMGDAIDAENEHSAGDGTSRLSSMEVDPLVVEPMVRRSERQPQPKLWPDFVTYSAMADVMDDPITIEEALSRHDGVQWKKAMMEEYRSLLQNNTWDLVDLPPNRKAIPCKWIFKTKRDGDGAIVRHKARLVIKGYAQRYGIDYKETFSPVVRYNSLRYLLSLAAQYDLDIEQLDAISAFLQGNVDEEIFMVQPEAFVENSSKVCRLNKAIYGLKQASRQWNKKLDGALKEIGFRQSALDPCVYFHVKGNLRTYIAVYVDDSMIFPMIQLQDVF